MTSEIRLSRDEIATRTLSAESLDGAARLFHQQGTLHIKSAFPRALVERLSAAFFDEYAGTPEERIRDTCLNVGDKRFMFTIAIKEPFNTSGLYASPLVLPIVRGLLGPDCILQSVGVVCAYPGAKMQHLHADHPLLFEESLGVNSFCPPYALHVVLPLVDLDEENGTTALWEGSHRMKSVTQEKWFLEHAHSDTLEGASLPFPRMGDCYFMDYRLRHRGMPNRSSRPRPILYLVYTRPWFLDRRNYEIQQRLSIEPEEVAKIPEEHRSLFATMLASERKPPRAAELTTASR